jgi:hypothetical protein
MDTPYQWTKQVASHWGGTRNGTIVHWPGGITAKGELRHQFAHVIDVAPTVLEAAGLPEPRRHPVGAPGGRPGQPRPPGGPRAPGADRHDPPVGVPQTPSDGAHPSGGLSASQRARSPLRSTRLRGARLRGPAARPPVWFYTPSEEHACARARPGADRLPAAAAPLCPRLRGGRGPRPGGSSLEHGRPRLSGAHAKASTGTP